MVGSMTERLRRNRVDVAVASAGLLAGLVAERNSKEVVPVFNASHQVVFFTLVQGCRSMKATGRYGEVEIRGQASPQLQFNQSEKMAL